jgi:hypothetical protein
VSVCLCVHHRFCRHGSACQARASSACVQGPAATLSSLMFAPSLNGMPMLDMQGPPPPHWCAPWLSSMAMRLSTDLTLLGTIAACVSANDRLGKQLNNSKQLAVPARFACVLPRRHSLLNCSKQPSKRMLPPCTLPGQPSPLKCSKQLGNEMPLPGVLPRQPSLLNSSRQSRNGMPLLGVLPRQPAY